MINEPMIKYSDRQPFRKSLCVTYASIIMHVHLCMYNTWTVYMYINNYIRYNRQTEMDGHVVRMEKDRKPNHVMSLVLSVVRKWE